MLSSRLCSKPLVIGLTAVAFIASALGFRDQVPPAVRDLVPFFKDMTTAVKMHGGGAIKRLKGSAPESTDAYWPGLPVCRNEKLVSMTRIGYRGRANALKSE